jgi:hypothetical protein
MVGPQMTDDRSAFTEARAVGKAIQQERRLAHADLKAIRRAVEMLPAKCQYHGDEIVRDYGMWRGEACCDTGKPALARREAEEALRRLEA